MAIGVLKQGLPRRRFCRIAELPHTAADWPLGPPDQGSTLGDLGPDDHLVVTIGSKALLADRRGLRCRVSALLFEPPVIHGRYYLAIRWIGRAFHRVLTHNSRLLQRLPNARFLPHGGLHLRAIPEVDRPKTDDVSLIASAKRSVEGHRLRHRVARWSRREAPALALFGRAYQPLADKAEGHLPYRFSVVIENSREPGYFTEKLVDCLLCACVPIYWGAPDIEHFFDPRGLIVCRTESEIRRAVLRCDEAEFRRRLPHLLENRRRAFAYADRRRNAALVLQREDDFALGSRSGSSEVHAAAA